ncbi:MAG: glycosyltransferase family 25 protein [Chlamydiia bacterium]|nr:glycosyltransferase family 25 protein [Chlamydiia bacterium]
MKAIDGIIYINLDHCVERKAFIETEFSRLNIPKEKIHRISGVYDQLNGTKGCLISHMLALDFALKKGWKSVLICEDDIFFTCDGKTLEKKVEQFFSFAKGEWDVFLLSGYYSKKKLTSTKDIIKIEQSWGSGTYLVHGNYVEKLLACFACGYEIAKNHLFFVQTQQQGCCPDTLWHILQKEDRWYGAIPKLAHQRALESNIEFAHRPFDRFDSIIIIDKTSDKEAVPALDKAFFSLAKVHYVQNPLSAIEKAISLNKMTTLIMHNHFIPKKNQKALDEEIRYFLAWLDTKWDLYLFESEKCETAKCEHPDYQRVTKLTSPYIYAIRQPFFQNLLNHFRDGKELSSFEIQSHHKIYSAKS